MSRHALWSANDDEEGGLQNAIRAERAPASAAIKLSDAQLHPIRCPSPTSSIPLAYGSIGGYSGSGRCSSIAVPTRQLRWSSFLVGNDMDGGLLRACSGAVDADIDTNEVRLHIRSDAPVGIYQPAGTLFSHLTVVDDFLS